MNGNEGTRTFQTCTC